MAGEPGNNIPFADDAIKAAQEAAGEASRANFEKQKEVFDRVNEVVTNSTENTPTPVVETPQVPGVVIKSLRTFQGDVAEAIKNQNASVVTIAIAEQQKKADLARNGGPKQNLGITKNEVERILGKKAAPIVVQEQVLPTSKPSVSTPTPMPAPAPKTPVQSVTFVQNPEPKKQLFDSETKRNTLTILVSVILIVLGVGAVFGFYLLQKEAPTIAPPPPVDQTIVSFNSKTVVSSENLGRDDLIKKLVDIRSTITGNDGDVHYVAFTKQSDGKEVTIDTPTFLTILRTSIPSNTLRSFSNRFMFGFYRFQNVNNPFILIKLNSFDNAFAGMLDFEKTLNTDLGPIFSARSIPITGFDNSTSTTKVVSIDAGVTNAFRDITIQNKDARILKNNRGEDILVYTFLDEQTLLITNSQSTFREILSKYKSGNLTR